MLDPLPDQSASPAETDRGTPHGSSSSLGYEATDVDFRGVLLLLGATVAGVACVLFGVWALQSFLIHDAARRIPALSPLARFPAVPPPPRIQSQPRQDYQAFLQTETRRLDSYGWTDRRKRKVHVPISTAIERMIQKHKSTPEGAR